MGKRGKSQKKDGGGNPSKRKLGDKHRGAVEDDMDDEIDAFHKQREIVSLDIDEDAGDSDQDSEQPVFDVENISEEDDEDEDNDAPRDTGLAAKIVRQQKFIKAKFGGVEDEMHSDDGEEEQNTILGRGKYQYYDADNRDFELQSSDDESAKDEEAEVLRLQRESAVSTTLEDYGLEDVYEDESNKELTFEEISVDEKNTKSLLGIDVADDMGTAYVEVKKDLNALSKEEKMNFLYNSAVELSGLLPDLNDALEELESRVNPLLSKVKKGEVTLEGGMHYLEVKQLLLLAYCQAITFYLLLKSEGHPVRDHPVVAHLTEIKSLLNKMKQLDENLPSGFEDILNKYNGGDERMLSSKENATEASDSFAKGNRSPVLVEAKEEAVSHGIAELEKVDSLIIEKNGGKRKYQNDEVGVQSVQSMKMLKVRAELEEKLKQKGVISSITPKADKPRKLLKLNEKLESYDDFGDDTVNVKRANQGSTNGRASKLAQLVAANQNKSKVVSGDDDLPQRDDILERRRKHELRVLAGAGIKSEDDAGDGNGIISDDGDVEMEDNETRDSEDELYEQVKNERLAKLAAKARMYSGPSNVPTLVETETIDGKRHITYQMEKNRGLTRPRKKEIKNPRKKYKLKHQKAVERRKGQVREVKKPIGRYGGEISGINAGISRSTRFKN